MRVAIVINRRTQSTIATLSLQAEEGAQILREGGGSTGNLATSPVPRIQRSQHPPRAESDPGADFRRLGGSENN